MALLHIEEPASPARPSMPPPASRPGMPPPAAARPLGPVDWAATFSLGFRPLYPLAAGWGLISVLLWVFAPGALRGGLNGVAWHAHEMLWGLVGTVAVAFLLTAGANWTGRNPLQGRGLMALVGLWLGARALLGWGGPGAPFLAGAAMQLAFYLLAAAALARVVHASGNSRNAGVAPMLAGLGLADAFFLAAVARGEPGAALAWVGTGMAVMAAIALLIARRVIPFFAMRAVPGLEIPLHTRAGLWQLGLALAAALAHALSHAAPLAAAMPLLQAAAALGWLAAGAMALWQVLSWRPRAVAGRPILWILYLGYAGLGLGLLVTGAQSAAALVGQAWPAAWGVHTLALAGFMLLIIGMLTRTALGHLGRPLVLDASMVWSYRLMIAAALARLAAFLPAPEAAARGLLHLAAVCWAAALVLYLWRFGPWFIRTRADQPSGRPIDLQRTAASARQPSQ